MVDELKTRITVEGDQAERALRDVSAQEKKLGEQTRASGREADKASAQQKKLAGKTREAGDAAQQTSRKLGGLRGSSRGVRTGLNSLLSSVRGLIGGLIGVGGLVAAWRANRQEMEQNVRLIRELADAQRDFLFLSSGNTGQELQAIKDAAELVGGKGSRVELTRTFAQLKSQTANASNQDRLELFQQLVETSLTTSAKPTQLVELFSKGSRFVPDAQQLQNIIAQTIIESPESDPAVLATLLPQVLPAGVAAGITPAETAGSLAFAAGEAGSASQGAVGLRNIILALRGRGTPESKDILQRTGAGPDKNFFAQLSSLSGSFSSGDLTLADLETLAGRENTALLSALLNKPKELRATVGRVVAAQTGDDITRVKLERTLAEFSSQNTDLLTRQAESRIESIRLEDQKSQKADLGRSLFEEQLRKQGINTIGRSIDLGLFDLATGFGVEPGLAASFIERPIDPNIPSVAEGLNRRANIDVGSIGDVPASATVIQNINHGTIINQARDPSRDDLAEGRPPN